MEWRPPWALLQACRIRTAAAVVVHCSHSVVGDHQSGGSGNKVVGWCRMDLWWLGHHKRRRRQREANDASAEAARIRTKHFRSLNEKVICKQVVNFILSGSVLLCTVKCSFTIGHTYCTRQILQQIVVAYRILFFSVAQLLLQ